MRRLVAVMALVVVAGHAWAQNALVGFLAAGNGGPAFSEIAVASYARAPITFQPLAGGTTANIAGATFGPSAGQSWGQITQLGVYDAAVGGNLIIWWPLATPLAVAANGTLELASQRLQLAFNDLSGSGSTSSFTQQWAAGTVVGQAAPIGSGQSIITGTTVSITSGALTAAAAITASRLPAGTTSSPGIVQIGRSIGTAAAGCAVANGASACRDAGSRAADHVSVADFGAVGGAVTYNAGASAAAGAVSLTVAGAAAVSLGEIVIGAGVTPGTVVASVAVQSGGGTTVIGLSAPLSAAVPAGQRFDFAIQDDYPAFVQAENSGARYIEVPAGPTREYYLSGYAGNVPGIVWKLNGAFFAQYGGLIDAVNLSLEQVPNTESLLNTMTYQAGEDTLFVTAANQPTGSPASYQKNGVHVQINQGDPSQYTFRGDSQTVVRDLVGYSVQGHCPAGNVKCSLFGANFSIFADAGSDGPMIANEIDVTNNAAANPESGSWDNKSGLSLIGIGSQMAMAMSVRGSAWQTGIEFGTDTLGKSWAVRTPGSQNASGIATTHSDYAYADHLGKLYGQSVHIVSGPTIGDSDPVGGVTIAGTAAGTIDLGNATLAAGVLPQVRFHLPSGAGTDAFDLVIEDSGSTLLVTDSAGNQILSGSRAGGVQATQLAGTNTTGAVATFGASRGAGALTVQLATSGADALRELGTQALQIQNAAGTAAAEFRQDGTARLPARPVSIQAGGYTLGTTDCGTVIRATGATASTLMVPTGLPIGCTLDVIQIGAGQVMFAGGTGETMQAYGSAAKTSGTYARAQLLVDSASTFVLSGQVQ